MRQLIKQRIKNEKGLTLIELLAVIVILGIIAAIAIPSIGNVIQKSREDAIKADAIQIINAAKMYVAGEGAAESVPVTATSNPLEGYLDDVTTFTTYTVNISDSNEITLDGTGSKGKVTIEFNDASISEINAAGRGADSIPAANPGS